MPIRIITSITIIIIRIILLYSTFRCIALRIELDLDSPSLALSNLRWLRSSDSRWTSSSLMTYGDKGGLNQFGDSIRGGNHSLHGQSVRFRLRSGSSGPNWPMFAPGFGGPAEPVAGCGRPSWNRPWFVVAVAKLANGFRFYFQLNK